MLVKNIIILLFLFNLSTYAQIKETITQSRKDFVGVKNKMYFKQPPYNQWFNQNFKKYQPDKKTIKKLKRYSDKFKIKAFMSVWCHDSKREVPHLYKILETIDFNFKNFEVIALDRANKTPKNLQEGFDINRTPTFIIYKKDKEIGRFIEYPRESLEKDLLKIVRGKSYIPSY